MSAREKCRAVPGQTVYDRLTNPAGYTGQYAAKFGTQTVKSDQKPQQKTQQAQNKPVTQQQSQQIKQSQNTQQQKQIKQHQTVYDRLNDVNSYTGSYRQRFDKEGHGIGSEKIAKGGQDPNGLANFVTRK